MRRLMFLSVLLMLMFGSLTPALAAGPELAIISPSSGAVIQGTAVKVDFKASGLKILASTVALAEYGKRPDANKTDEGHLHITLDLWPLVVWEKPEAYTFTNVPPGEHQLKVELVNNDHSAREPAITQVVRFRTESVAPVPATMPRTGAPETSAGAVVSVLLFAAICLIGCGIVLRRNGKRQS
jgi:hypothetical protein